MNVNANLIKTSKVWNQDFKNWDEILDKGILECEYIPSEKKTMLSILRTGKLIEEIVEAALARYDLSMAQKSVLEALYFSETVNFTQSQLSKYIFTSKANTSTLLTRMEIKGLISRKESEHSKREKLVSLTNKGSMLLEKLFNDLGNKDLDIFSNEKISKEISKELKLVRAKIKNLKL